MLRVCSDFLKAADTRRVTLLSSIGMSAAFDCVDHSILMQRLQSTVGLFGVVLDWIKSFLSDLAQQLSTIGDAGRFFRRASSLVLARALLYILYTADLANVVAKHGLSLHQYADDCQHEHSSWWRPSCCKLLSTCLVDVEAWLKASRLRLNPAKIQVMWLGSQHLLLSRLDIVHVLILSSCIGVQNTARDLGVLGEHVASVSRSGYYQLRQLRTEVRCLSEDATKTLVQAFTVSRLDYCNALFLASRTVFPPAICAERCCKVPTLLQRYSPVHRQLHWLPLRQRVVFKIATLVYRSLPGHAPWYLADDCQLVTDARARLLRSTDTRTLTVHRTFSCFGDRTFAAAVTKLWNSLPSDLRKADLSYSRFRQSLKTFSFGQSDYGALWTF